MKRNGPVPILWAAFGAAVGSTVIELMLWPIAGEDAIHN
ncbi:sodium:proline symporter, partial [Paraburkholderia sp. SIMBA_050]